MAVLLLGCGEVPMSNEDRGLEACIEAKIAKGYQGSTKPVGFQELEHCWANAYKA
jgi:hypothetical protein